MWINMLLLDHLTFRDSEISHILSANIFRSYVCDSSGNHQTSILRNFDANRLSNLSMNIEGITVLSFYMNMTLSLQ